METSRYGRLEKYLLLDRIAVGGMAEVYRGKLTGEKGFEKPIVVKKILPQVAEDKEILAHFIDEARLAALLQHENIIHVYDFGEAEGSYFIAMEYLFGKDLSSVIEKSIQKNLPVSLENALFIISKICEGLEYAHNLFDLQGKPLNIIHRDISPQNIFLTYDGKIKIIDFGIAKTSSQTSRTQVGIIKGKVAYMSPEQAEGKLIDKRSDIFSTGILLYEMVAQKPMYEGDTAQILLKAINAEYDPPEKLSPNLPSKVFEILNRTLAKAPDMRYQSCGEMLTDIEDCMYKLENRPNGKMLSHYIISLFESEYSIEKKNLIKIMESAPQQNFSGSGTVVLDKDYLKSDVIKNQVDAKDDGHKNNFLIVLKKLFLVSKTWLLLVSALILTGIIVLLFLSGDGKLTKEKYNKIRMGMTYSEVEKILGGGDECNFHLGIKNCIWGSEAKYIEVTFIADRAVSFLNKGL